MDFAIVLKTDKAGKVSVVYAGGSGEGGEADAAFQAQPSGRVSFFRLYRGQAFRSKDLFASHTGNDPAAPDDHGTPAGDLPAGSEPGDDLVPRHVRVKGK